MRTSIVAAAALAAPLPLLFACSAGDPRGGGVPPSSVSVSAADADKSSRTALGMVVTWAKMVKAQARRPESVQWGSLLANKDGSVVCLEYRAPDESGTADLKRVAFVTGAGTRQPSAWDQHCTQRLDDMAYAVQFIGD